MCYPAAAYHPYRQLDTDTQEEIKTQINAWLNKE